MTTEIDPTKRRNAPSDIPSGPDFLDESIPNKDWNIVHVFHPDESSLTYPAYLQIYGSYAAELLAGQIEAPSGGSVFLVVDSVVEQSEQELPPPSEMIAEFRMAFRVSISDLATILRVERPTIYAWLDDRWELKPENALRLSQLFKHARYWSKLQRKPIESEFKKKIPSGLSLFELFKQKSLADSTITSALDFWANKIPIKVTGIPHDSVRAAAMRQGIDVGKRDDQQNVIDRLTGKRTSEER